MPGVALRGLRPRDYEHPYDRRALAALEANAALSTVVTKLNQYGIDRTLRLQYSASNVRASGGLFQDACAALREACRVLDLTVMPEVYVDWEREISSILTVGSDHPIIVLTSPLLDALTYDELLFVLGHEIGHFRSRHIPYSQLAMILPVLGEVLKTATLGVGGLLSGGLQLSVNNWLRMSDFTADRAGMLACQDLDVACSALIKLGGAVEAGHGEFDVADFRAQAKEFAGYDFDSLDKMARVVSALRSESPWTVMRASELIEWIDAGKYDSLLKSSAAGDATPSR